MTMRFDRAEWKALLRDFPRRPGAWRVLATNLVPLAGVLLLGWVAGVATLSFFADAVLTAAVLTFVLTVHAMNDTMPHVRGISRVLGIAAIWLFLVPFVALPVVVGGMFASGFAGVSMLEGWTRSAEYGSSPIRPTAISARMSRSDSSTGEPYPCADLAPVTTRSCRRRHSS